MMKKNNNPHAILFEIEDTPIHKMMQTITCILFTCDLNEHQLNWEIYLSGCTGAVLINNFI